ncbi:MAG: RNA 2',3'-cyclic phosphodiesterase [Candidatus Diapherotrites archaeon]|nr:RNA 2',3'-cyclic phosphodiesterase [Candidatus Diapherotrites archaeon]
MDKELRLFFAVNLPKEVKQEIAEKMLPLIPADKWRKVLPENLHVTMQFLGHLPSEAVNRMQADARGLQNFEPFEAELNCVGHFKGRVLWIGIGKGTEEFNLLNRKLQEIIGTHDEIFHAHVTLSRNRGAGKQETDALIEKMRAIGFRKKIQVGSIELMRSELHKAGPEYSVVFSVPFRALQAEQITP